MFSLTGHYLAGPRQFCAVEPGVEGGRLLVKDFHPEFYAELLSLNNPRCLRGLNFNSLTK